MRPTTVLRWTVRAVPGVYRAAHSSGLGHPDAVRVVEASAYALLLARKRYPRRWRAENAVRHFIWQAWLAATYGDQVATAVGRAHERLSNDAADSAVDQENNRLGREYGVAHAGRIRGGAMRAALSALADEAGRRWAAGQLRSATTASGGGT